MKKNLRIGIIDLVSRGPTKALWARVMYPNLASIMPQVLGVWCEEEGHNVAFVCYTGFEDLIEELPKDTDLVFITKYRQRWVRTGEKGNPIDSVSTEFTKLLRNLNLKRPGLSFYTLRHVCETIGGESRDQVAVNAIMGHVDNSMAGVYRERISDERLKAVTNTVREWLWAEPRER